METLFHRNEPIRSKPVNDKTIDGLEKITFKKMKSNSTLNERFTKIMESNEESIKTTNKIEVKDQSEEMEVEYHNSINTNGRKLNVIKELAKKFKKRLQQNNITFKKTFHSKSPKIPESKSMRSKAKFYSRRYRSSNGRLTKKELDYEIDLHMAGVKGTEFFQSKSV